MTVATDALDTASAIAHSTSINTRRIAAATQQITPVKAVYDPEALVVTWFSETVTIAETPVEIAVESWFSPNEEDTIKSVVSLCGHSDVMWVSHQEATHYAETLRIAHGVLRCVELALTQEDVPKAA